jgi:hypothetical protein
MTNAPHFKGVVLFAQVLLFEIANEKSIMLRRV